MADKIVDLYEIDSLILALEKGYKGEDISINPWKMALTLAYELKKMSYHLECFENQYNGYDN